MRLLKAVPFVASPLIEVGTGEVLQLVKVVDGTVDGVDSDADTTQLGTCHVKHVGFALELESDVPPVSTKQYAYLGLLDHHRSGRSTSARGELPQHHLGHCLSSQEAIPQPQRQVNTEATKIYTLIAMLQGALDALPYRNSSGVFWRLTDP